MRGEGWKLRRIAVTLFLRDELASLDEDFLNLAVLPKILETADNLMVNETWCQADHVNSALVNDSNLAQLDALDQPMFQDEALACPTADALTRYLLACRRGRVLTRLLGHDLVGDG